MSAASLTSRERVERALTRRDHDRIPRFDQFWRETIERFKAEGMTGSPHQLFDFDFAWLAWISPAPFPGRNEKVGEDAETQVTVNAWGEKVRYWKKRSGTPEHLGWECADPDTWRRRFKPGLTPENNPLELKPIAEKLEAGRKAGRWCCLCAIQTYEAARHLLGDEVMMMAMAEDPGWIREISRVYTSLVIAQFRRILEAGLKPDGLWIFEDLAYRQAPLCSPAMYRDTIWPDHKRMADFAHANGMKLIFHTDGNIIPYMDLFVAAGLDCLQPLEAKASVDIRALCPKYGRQLAFFGNMDMMVAITNDRDKVEDEVRSKLAAGMATKGYLYHSDHSVPPQVSWQTYQWIMELVERYGKYG